MFLPLDRKPDWKNPPLITLILVVINILAFYIWQHNDDKYRDEAYEYYIHSGMHRIEIREYLKYIDKSDTLTEQDITQGTHKAQAVFKDMYIDGSFQEKLNNNKIIKPDDPNYADWRTKRDKYLWLHNKVVANQYGLTPSHPSVTTYITNMFLHGSTGHLLGNMLMLILLGLGIEVILGRLYFLIGYLFSGLTAGFLYVALYAEQAIAGVGASGAIAGVLGMSIIIYGMRKINFFYFLFVYFDYVKARAIWILPLYVLSQAIIQFGFNTNINVAAHIGGLIGGLLFAGVLKLIPNTIKHEYVDENQHEDQFHEAYAQASQFLARMELDQAKKIFQQLHQLYPQNMDVTQKLFTIEQYNPASEQYHAYAHKLLNQPGSDSNTVKSIHHTFTQYASRAKPKPRWTPEMLISLVTRFAANNYLDEAEKLINYLIKAKQDFTHNAEGLSALVKYYNGKNKDKSVHYKNLLIDLYPDSPQAKQFSKSSL